MVVKKRLKYLLIIFCLVAGGWCNAQPQAYIQIIHNCADPALDSIDLYYNGVVVDSPMLFRTVFPGNGLYTVTADSPVVITIAHKHSYGVATDSFRTFFIDSFQANHRYALFISGVFYTDSFAPNPGGRNIGLSLAVIDGLDSIASSDSVAAFKFFQGATDLDTVQALDRLSQKQLFASTVYDSIPDTPYTALDSLHHQLWEFQLLSPDSSKNYGTYEVDLTNYEQQTFVLFTSGFLNQAKNDSGPVMGLFGLFLNGSVVEFPTKTAMFQLIHNSPDTALDSVDVYVNGSLADTSFPFRTATPAIAEYAYATYDIGIADKHSTSVSDTFWHQVFTFKPDTFYIATMEGLRNPATYAANPNGISTAFNVLITTPAEYTASSGFNFDFFLVNGITDAGALYLTPQGGPTLCDSVLYDTQTNYVSLPGQSYPLSLIDSTPGGGGTSIGTYFANFLAFTGQSGVLLASGFLNPANNNNGPSAGLYMSPIAGGPFIPLFIYTSISTVDINNDFSLYPNPASNTVFVHLQHPQDEITALRLCNLSGQTVNELRFAASADGQQNLAIDVSNINDGLYILQISSRGETANYKLVIAR